VDWNVEIERNWSGLVSIVGTLKGLGALNYLFSCRLATSNGQWAVGSEQRGHWAHPSTVEMLGINCGTRRAGQGGGGQAGVGLILKS
jgi:hypothetical protein